MTSQLDTEIDSLLKALRLKPREQWAGEAKGLEVAGRCAGSYGCGTPVAVSPTGEEMVARAVSSSGEEFVTELANLIRAGVAVENAAAALARKFGGAPSLAPKLTVLMALLKDPDANRQSFADILSEFADGSDAKKSKELILAAINTGNLDGLAD